MPMGGKKACLLINDEDRSARAVIMNGTRISTAQKIKLIGKKPSPVTIGSEPSEISCSEGEGKFKEMDGEAVAYDAPYFYIAGSHACSRKSREFRLSSFIVARIHEEKIASVLDSDSEESLNVKTTYRLADVLKSAPIVGQYFAHDLTDAENGLDLEGFAVSDGRVFAGLRGPNLNGEAFVVSADAGYLFSRDEPAARGEIRVDRLKLGDGIGIRDLAPLKDGRLLVLTGPVRERKQPYGVFLADPKVSGGGAYLAKLQPVTVNGKDGKAEALGVLSSSANKARLIVLFDGLPSGAPREYEVALK